MDFAMADTKPTPKPKLPFLPLPRELRDKIYHHVWEGTKIGFRWKLCVLRAHYSPQPDMISYTKLPSWLLTNQSFLKERMEQFYFGAHIIAGKFNFDKEFCPRIPESVLLTPLRGRWLVLAEMVAVCFYHFHEPRGGEMKIVEMKNQERFIKQLNKSSHSIRGLEIQADWAPNVILGTWRHPDPIKVNFALLDKMPRGLEKVEFVLSNGSVFPHSRSEEERRWRRNDEREKRDYWKLKDMFLAQFAKAVQRQIGKTETDDVSGGMAELSVPARDLDNLQ